MINIGIYCPEWLLSKHSTDHVVAKSFARLKEFVPCETQMIATFGRTLTVNLNKVARKVLGPNAHIPYHAIKSGADVIYCYGAPKAPENFFKAAGKIPTVVTTGFMTDRYIADRGNSKISRQQEADQLAKNLERATMIHFHTEGGRQRFLSYRPEFESRTISIPFFLPNLVDMGPQESTSEGVNILFVGYEGVRKGINELAAAINSLGESYLKEHKVSFTVVSRDRPELQVDIPFVWHPRLPHSEILELMKNADIFVLVPRRESYGLVFVEAMGASCAIIGDDDQPREEILQGAGLRVKPREAAALAQALDQLIIDKELRNNLQLKSYEVVKGNYLPGVVGEKYLNLFKTVTAN